MLDQSKFSNSSYSKAGEIIQQNQNERGVYFPYFMDTFTNTSLYFE